MRLIDTLKQVALVISRCFEMTEPHTILVSSYTDLLQKAIAIEFVVQINEVTDGRIIWSINVTARKSISLQHCSINALASTDAAYEPAGPPPMTCQLPKSMSYTGEGNGSGS